MLKARLLMELDDSYKMASFTKVRFTMVSKLDSVDKFTQNLIQMQIIRTSTFTLEILSKVKNAVMAHCIQKALMGFKISVLAKLEFKL